MPPTAKRIAALRRLKLEDLLAKLEQIEEQARLSLDEYPQGHTLERQRLILTIARQMKAHLADQLVAGQREPVERTLEGGERALS